MCLLTYIPEGRWPNTEALLQGAANNPDGHGFAIIAGNRIIVRRSLYDPNSLLDEFLEFRSKYDGPALFHSRIGTAGKLSLFNCHPFYLGGDDIRTVIAHNGILPQKAQPHRKDIRSDTRKFAEVWLPKGRFGHLHTKGGRKHLEQWLGRDNKLVVLNINDSLPFRTLIFNGLEGTWKGGIWYSNHSFEYTYVRAGYSSSGWANRYDDCGSYDSELPIKVTTRKGHTEWRISCPLCHAFASVETVIGICKFCQCCTYCEEWVEECLCYVPKNQRKDRTDDGLSLSEIVAQAKERAEKESEEERQRLKAIQKMGTDLRREEKERKAKSNMT